MAFIKYINTIAALNITDFFGDKNIIVIAVDASVSVTEPKLYMPLGNRLLSVKFIQEIFILQLLCFSDQL